MIKGINHIGLCVRNLDETVPFLEKMMGAKVLQTVRFEEAGQISCEIQFGDSKYELMEPIGTEGVAGKFLEKNGEGFHHISILSDDFDADIAHMKEMGIKIIGISETGGMRYAFTHPKTTGGVLYEIAGK